jgi:hypothetical protein
MHPHPWYEQVKREKLSSRGLISNFSDEPGEATYQFQALEPGEYDFWIRANPIQARLSYQLGPQEWIPIDLEFDALEPTNIAADDKPDLRFLAWVHVGKITLVKGTNNLALRMDSENHNHGYVDCFVLTQQHFRPSGLLKPGSLADRQARLAQANKGWFAFDPTVDQFSDDSLLNLRPLNEELAGDHGFIATKGGQFVQSITNEPVRFWGVNGPSSKDPKSLVVEARMLAKRGVNLVRVHGGYFDSDGQLDLEKVRHAQNVVSALKKEGIYTHFSIYFPLWLTPKPDNPLLKGYDGKTHPFAALFFNRDFQAQYHEWWKALLLSVDPATGKRLVDDPAVMGLEMQNEDSLFFWTFDEKRIPDAQLRIMETQFAEWLVKQHGSLDAARQIWNGQNLPRDNSPERRMAFRPLWNIVHDKTTRDRDTAQFLVETQRRFYAETYQFLRGLGFKGVITASNWLTASPEVLGPLEEYSYLVADFIDRHGYFSCHHRGENSAWSLRDNDTFLDRSALRFDSEQPSSPKQFSNPVMEIGYDDKPSMISETTFCRPNRYRSEAPLLYAAYGALQDTDAVVHFALDGANWSVKPNFFMQPWTLMSPAMIGQFPAAAVLFRKGLVKQGDVIVDVNLNLADLLTLSGTPMPQDAAFDELRAKDVPAGTTLTAGNVVDPLVHLAGRTRVRFTQESSSSKLLPLEFLVNRKAQTVVSSTGELRLDYDNGLLTINAPAAQGLSGCLARAGKVALGDIDVESQMELAHIIAVSMDGLPIRSSKRILLQVMSEEKTNGFRVEPTSKNELRIASIGDDPWLVREFNGIVSIRREDAARLKVTKIDANGTPTGSSYGATNIALDPQTLYYIITP